MELHGHVAAVVPQVAGDETTAATIIGDVLIPVADTVDFSEDGGHVRILDNIYAYVSMDDGEDSGAPSITLEAPGLLDAVPAETVVEVWNPNTATVVTEWKVDVTDDTDGSTAVATLSHALVPMMSDGMPLTAGDSVTVRVPKDGDEWTVIEIHGKRPVIEATFTTDAPENSRVEIGKGSTFGYPAEEVRFYTGDASEDGPAVVSVSVPGGNGELRLTAPNMSASPPFLFLQSDPVDSTSANNMATMLARFVQLVSAWGPSLTVDSSGHTFDGEVTMIDVLNAVMESGSVGTGTFRDSVDARVTALVGPGWTSFAPTSTNITVGNGTLTGAYLLVGKLVHFRIKLTFGSTSAITGSPTFTLPVSATAARTVVGGALMYDDSASLATAYKGGWVFNNTVNVLQVRDPASAVLSATSPFTWATADELVLEAYYEAS